MTPAHIIAIIVLLILNLIFVVFNTLSNYMRDSHINVLYKKHNDTEVDRAKWISRASEVFTDFSELKKVVYNAENGIHEIRKLKEKVQKIEFDLDDLRMKFDMIRTMSK